jgi:hypothetical protein
MKCLPSAVSMLISLSLLACTTTSMDVSNLRTGDSRSGGSRSGHRRVEGEADHPKIIRTIIGYSVQNREIALTVYNPSDRVPGILLVGGIHGRYESASVDVMEALESHFASNLPKVSVGIVANLNPDSFFSGAVLDDDTPSGFREGRKVGLAWHRFNANYVDLNRNWDTSSWRHNVTYRGGDFREGAGGDSPFSEPETRALRDLILADEKQTWGLVLMYHSYVSIHATQGTAQPAYSGYSKNPLIDRRSAAYARAYVQAAQGYAYLPRWKHYEAPGEFLAWAGAHDVTAVEIELPAAAGEDAKHYLVRQIDRTLKAVESLVGFKQMDSLSPP